MGTLRASVTVHHQHQGRFIGVSPPTPAAGGDRGSCSHGSPLHVGLVPSTGEADSFSPLRSTRLVRNPTDARRQVVRLSGCDKPPKGGALSNRRKWSEGGRSGHKERKTSSSAGTHHCQCPLLQEAPLVSQVEGSPCKIGWTLLGHSSLVPELLRSQARLLHSISQLPHMGPPSTRGSK